MDKIRLNRLNSRFPGNLARSILSDLQYIIVGTFRGRRLFHRPNCGIQQISPPELVEKITSLPKAKPLAYSAQSIDFCRNKFDENLLFLKVLMWTNLNCNQCDVCVPKHYASFVLLYIYNTIENRILWWSP